MPSGIRPICKKLPINNAYWSAFRINRGKMLNINVKLEEPLKILKISSGSSPGVDMSIHVITLPFISRETVSLNGHFLTQDKHTE
jgi:hypothetical protein